MGISTRVRTYSAVADGIVSMPCQRVDWPSTVFISDLRCAATTIASDKRKSEMLSPISLGRNDGLTRIDIADVGYACGFVGCTIRGAGT